MEIYELKRQNLPAEVLVYKEIGKRILSSKQYKRLRTLKLAVNPRKTAGYGTYHGSTWRFGGRAIHLGTGVTDWENTSNGYRKFRIHKSILEEDIISAYIHELAHMVQYNRRDIKIRGRVHNRTFWRLHERLGKNYRAKVEPELAKITEECQQVANGFRETRETAEQKRRTAVAHGNSTEGKLEKTLSGIKRWTTKQRRAETALKKLNRRKKLYETLLEKASTEKEQTLLAKSQQATSSSSS